MVERYFASREKNQIRFEFSNEFFGAMQTVSFHIDLFMACKERLDLYRNRALFERESLDRVS